MAKWYDIDTSVRINGGLTINGDISIPSNSINAKNISISGVISGDGSGLTNLNSSAMADVIKSDGSRAMSGDLKFGTNGSYIGAFTGGVIPSLIGGTTNTGLVLSGANNGHVVIELKSNDSSDGFAIVASSGNDATGHNINSVPFRVYRTGDTIVSKDLTVSGNINGVNLQNLKSSFDSHNHDNRYYTETEINSLLSSKSDLNHIHSIATTSAHGFMSAEDKAKINSMSNLSFGALNSGGGYIHFNSGVDNNDNAWIGVRQVTDNKTRIYINMGDDNTTEDYVAITTTTGEGRNIDTDFSNISERVKFYGNGVVDAVGGYQWNGQSLDSRYEGKGTIHDDRYYTETEIDSKLLSKSDVGHGHDYQQHKLTDGSIAIKATDASDWNDYSNTGFYMGLNLSNQTQGSSWRYMTSIKHNDSYNVQIMNDFSGDTMGFRSKYNGTWKPWRMLWHDGNMGHNSGLDADTIDGVQASSLARGVSASYSSVSGDEDGTDGWYTLFSVSDSANSPVQCNIKAYAHTSVSFIVTKGFGGGNSIITILNANTNSTNSGYKYIKGIRVVNDGTVQVKLNGGSGVKIDVQAIGNGVNPSLSTTLIKHVGDVTVNDIVDPIQNASMRTRGEIYAKNNSKVWHEGDFNPDSKLNLSGGTMTGGLMFLSTATSGPSASTPTALSYGKLQAYGALTIAGDTDGSKTEDVIIATGYGVSPTSAQGLRIGYDALTWKNNNIWHSGNFNPSNYLNKSTPNESVQSGFTIDGSGFIGSSGTAGNIHIRNSSGGSVIQLTGDNTSKASGVKSYISSSGDASFDGSVSVNTLNVSNRNQVSNLNSEMVGGISGKDINTKEVDYEIGGSGVYSGLNVVQSGDGQQTQVTVNSGIVYTSSGKRVVIPTSGYSVSAPSTTTNSHRIDTIYIAGASEGNNEGTIRHKQGSYSVSPTPPSIPSDGIALADVYMGSNQGTILNNKITDRRMIKNVRHKDDTLYIDKAIVKRIADKVYIDGPIEYPKYTKRITIPSGQTSVTWTHNIGVSSYAVFLSCNSPEPHIYWSNQTNSQITINLDDVCDNDVEIHVILFDCD